MNLIQRIVLLASVISIGLFGYYPPVKNGNTGAFFGFVELPYIGVEASPSYALQVDVPLLICIWLGVCLVAFLLWSIFDGVATVSDLVRTKSKIDFPLSIIIAFVAVSGSALIVSSYESKTTTLLSAIHESSEKIDALEWKVIDER